jgi:hypothetical protein
MSLIRVLANECTDINQSFTHSLMMHAYLFHSSSLRLLIALCIRSTCLCVQWDLFGEKTNKREEPLIIGHLR